MLVNAYPLFCQDFGRNSRLTQIRFILILLVEASINSKTTRKEMDMKILSLLILLVFTGFLGRAAADYQPNSQDRTTWQSEHSKQHWSSYKKMRTNSFSDSRDDDWFRSKRHRRHFTPIPRHRKSFPIIIYRQKNYDQPAPVKEEPTVSPRTFPAPRPLSPQRCSGDTVYSRDKNTGELTIRYVSPAEKC